MSNTQEYIDAIAAVDAGNPTQQQIDLTQKMAKQASFLNSNPLPGKARRALESLSKKKQ